MNIKEKRSSTKNILSKDEFDSFFENLGIVDLLMKIENDEDMLSDKVLSGTTGGIADKYNPMDQYDAAKEGDDKYVWEKGAEDIEYAREEEVREAEYAREEGVREAEYAPEEEVREVGYNWKEEVGEVEYAWEEEVENDEYAWEEKEEDEEYIEYRLEVESENDKDIQNKEERDINYDGGGQETDSIDLSLDWDVFLNTDVNNLGEGVQADSIPDGLILSLSNRGCVDIGYISAVTGENARTVISTLKGAIYQNPDTWEECYDKGWETADEYLSGNMKVKWRAAKEANEKYNGYFSDNIKAIEDILPPMVATDEIYITLGSPWIPTDVIDDFIQETFGWNNLDLCGRVKHDELTGTWEIPNKNRYYDRLSVTRNYGTEKMNALYIIEKTLNMKTVAVYDTIETNTTESGKKRIINRQETVLALEKQKKLIKKFQKWVWKDEERKKRLEKIFEDKFTCIRRRIFDGSYLTFPTMSPDISLYPYQKDAVARILFSKNTLLAHDVGSGKTYEMIAAGMELKRMGISDKNLFVVPNNITGQWKNIFMSMYPKANILCVEPKSFKKDKRKEVLEQIRDNDFDGIIMAYSCFEQIPLSKEYYMEELGETRANMLRVSLNKNKTTGNLKKKIKEIDEKIGKLAVSTDKLYEGVYFNELGITRMFVDEAHNFKNVPIETKVDKVLGISASGSKKCREMLDKVHFIQKQNDGGGVVMATGTPITNSVTDAFIMQKYLQSGELAMLELQNFDSWIGMFAQRVTEFEIDVDTSGYRLATRFAKFHNLPELTTLLASIADFHQVDDSAGIPDFDGYSDLVIAKTREFNEYLKDISQRAENVRKGDVDRKEDNMLKITTDGRKAALDLRLVNKEAGFTVDSKAASCAAQVTDIYHRTDSQKGTQLIFCDSSTPKEGFNIYDEVKRLLIGNGVPEDMIAYIHDAETEKKREKLFEKVRNGEIRVLIGSTFKLGLGVNVQNKLVAIHHLDVPWRPADMTQREGRILRQGNENSEVYIFRYITEGSFDAYSWQLLETKQRFITGLLSGSIHERSGSDIEDTVLDYAEVKALAVGNPLVKQRVEAANELAKYSTLQKKLSDTKMALEREKNGLPNKIEHQEDKIHKCELDVAFCVEVREKAEEDIKTATQKKEESEERRALRERIHNAVLGNEWKETERELLEYRGFEIILPANMTLKRPFVWLRRVGRYQVELGGTEVGNLVRIDNYLDNLDRHLAELNEELERLRERREAIEEELNKNESYADKIEKYSKLVKKLDKKLGIDKEK